MLLIKDADDNGVFHVDAIGGYLYFNDGYLTDFQPSDGLNKWAKGWKKQNLDFISNYEACAKKHWGSRSDKIIQEINAQADAYANIPGGWKNSFIKLHRTDAGTINFVMLRVCHHNEPITLSYFKEINHGRYMDVPESEADTTQYRLGNFLYTFNQEGDLVEHSQI